MTDDDHLISELRAALRESIECTRIFHGPGWEIYRDHSPEMARFRFILEEADRRLERRAAAHSEQCEKQ